MGLFDQFNGAPQQGMPGSLAALAQQYGFAQMGSGAQAPNAPGQGGGAPPYNRSLGGYDMPALPAGAPTGGAGGVPSAPAMPAMPEPRLDIMGRPMADQHASPFADGMPFNPVNPGMPEPAWQQGMGQLGGLLQAYNARLGAMGGTGRIGG